MLKEIIIYRKYIEMAEKNIYTNSMNQNSLSNLSKTQLINLLLRQNTKIQLLKNKLNNEC